MQIGRNEGKREVARSLLNMGMPHDAIREATGLSEDALAQLCQESTGL